MNKRLLDLLTGLSGILTIVAATPDNKDIVPLLPVTWQPYLIKAGLIATLLLRVLAFCAPPTPSPIPARANKSRTTKNERLRTCKKPARLA